MFRFAKGIDIKNLSIREISLGILLIAVIGLVGLIGMEIMNRNMTSMYKNNLKAIAGIEEVRKNFLQLRILVNKASISYDDTFDTKILEEYEKIEESIRVSREIQQKDDIVGKIDSVEQNVNEYMKTWEKSKLNLKGTGNLSEEQYNSLSDLSNKIGSELNQIREDNESLVDEVNSNSVKVFMINVRNTYIIIHIALIFLASSGFIIIRSMAKSNKETVNNLDMITYGYLAANIHTQEKSAFSRIKIALNRMFENIKALVTSIKSQYIERNDNAERLSAAIHEISLASQNAAAAIEVTSKEKKLQLEDAAYINRVYNQFSEQLDEFMKSMSKVVSTASNLKVIPEDNVKKAEVLISSMHEVQAVFNQFAKETGCLDANVMWNTSLEAAETLEMMCSSEEESKASHDFVEEKMIKTDNYGEDKKKE